MADATCTGKGCSKKAVARGWCATHYSRWRKHGDPEHVEGGTPPGEARAWLEDHLDRGAPGEGDACVEWPFGTFAAGYGALWDSERKRNDYVTHLVLEGTGRPRPGEDAVARHSCHNPPCVRADHLRWGSHGDNMDDMAMAGRAYRPKLTEEKVLAIRRGRESGRTLASLAREFSVSAVTVRSVVTRRTWKHVP